MKLEEAVERLKKDLNKRDGEIAICFAQDLETVLQEIEHLQKENEELKNIDLTTVHIKGVCDEKERWRYKINEKIEFIKSLKEKIYYEENVISILESLID